MPEKIETRCHYCGILKEEYERNSGNYGILVAFRSNDDNIENLKEYSIWFCGKTHRDFWLEKYMEKITVIGNT